MFIFHSCLQGLVNKISNRLSAWIILAQAYINPSRQSLWNITINSVLSPSPPPLSSPELWNRRTCGDVNIACNPSVWYSKALGSKCSPQICVDKRIIQHSQDSLIGISKTHALLGRKEKSSVVWTAQWISDGAYVTFLATCSVLDKEVVVIRHTARRVFDQLTTRL